MESFQILSRFPLLWFWAICTYSLSIATLTIHAQTKQTQNSKQHDVVLLLSSGPQHIRLYVSDGDSSLEQLRQSYMESLVAKLDTDADGKLERDETTNHPLFVSGRRFTGNKFLQSLRATKPYTSQEIELAIDRAAGRLITFRQNEALVDQDLNVFRVLDEDESGLVEREEMRTAVARVAARDSDFDECVTFDEFLDQPAENAANLAILGQEEPPPSIYSELMRDASEPILAQRLIRVYDKNRDAQLSSVELGWDKERFAELDQSGDGLLSVQELSKLKDSTPDIELSIDFGTDSDDNMKLVSTRGDVNISKDQSDVVKINSPAVDLSISYRHRDPLEEADTNARNAFNAIDDDANGYLDREEIVDHQRFERYLFDAMDRNDDDRVFAEEMLEYVREYTLPASTSCQVTLFDMGNGYFQLLDDNEDGRISVRELRILEQQLVSAINDAGSINPSRMSKSFRIEIKRGGVSLFGRVDRPEADSPTAILGTSDGPIWFQRMDRNSDGDLTWDEFLGPRAVFHDFDKDQDGLIDPKEASSGQ